MTTENRQRTADNARRFDRGSWLALGIVLLIAVAATLATAATLARAGDGCQLDADSGTLVSACMGGWPTPLRRGDELIAIDGVALSDGISMQPQQAPPGWVQGGTARYTIKRGDATLAEPLGHIVTLVSDGENAVAATRDNEHRRAGRNARDRSPQE